jgi:hypothetical protein
MKYFIIYVIITVTIILFFSFINSQHATEGFTPKIREFYRPHIRNARIIYENFTNYHKQNMTNILRKLKIIA